MADAAERVAGLATGAVRLKWPNDLVIGDRKVGGVLGESDGLGTADPQVVVGIGVNVDWPAAAFPPELAGSMTSLREASGDQPVDREALLGEFLAGLATRHAELASGGFDDTGWAERQATTGRDVTLMTADGGREVAHATGVDPESGALLVAGPAGDGRAVLSAEIVHVRLGEV
jgi:BirA family biotin operon repressor/biotin-[acetyl-CoA-carboxylase] ligase